MGLQSRLFRGDPKLEACLVSDPAHAITGAVGAHVGKIQSALQTVFRATIDAAELAAQRYGPSTASAVLAYKTNRGIINRNYQTRPDNIVGKMTIDRLDKEMLTKETGGGGVDTTPPWTTPPVLSPPDVKALRAATIARAKQQSRVSLRQVYQSLNALQMRLGYIHSLPDREDKQRELAILMAMRARDIAVISRRLIVAPVPDSPEFRTALNRAVSIIYANLVADSSIIDEGSTGRCDPARWLPKGPVNAATSVDGQDPRVSVCDLFFNNPDVLWQRDVITHEFFHLARLADVEGHLPWTTEDSLRNADTMAQVVAYIYDRYRQVNSNGTEQQIPLLPTP